MTHEKQQGPHSPRRPLWLACVQQIQIMPGNFPECKTLGKDTTSARLLPESIMKKIATKCMRNAGSFQWQLFVRRFAPWTDSETGQTLALSSLPETLWRLHPDQFLLRRGLVRSQTWLESDLSWNLGSAVPTGGNRPVGNNTLSVLFPEQKRLPFLTIYNSFERHLPAREQFYLNNSATMDSNQGGLRWSAKRFRQA